MSRVKRKEDVFYMSFQEFSAMNVAAGELFLDVVTNWPNTTSKITELKEYETRCDHQVSKIINTLNNSFITPFDREDISAIALQLDEICDGLENVSARFELYDIDAMRPEAQQLAVLILEAIRCLDKAFANFPNYKKNPSVVQQLIECNDVEDEGDRTYRAALGNIFREGNAIEAVKWKSLFDKMEDTLDACKDVANLVNSVIVKNG